MTFDPPLCAETLGPGGETTVDLDREITAGQMRHLKGESMALYLIGEIRFRDAFGKHRWVKFRYMKGGDVDWEGSSFYTAEDGNHTSEDDERG